MPPKQQKKVSKKKKLEKVRQNVANNTTGQGSSAMINYWARNSAPLRNLIISKTRMNTFLGALMCLHSKGISAPRGFMRGGRWFNWHPTNFYFDLDPNQKVFRLITTAVPAIPLLIQYPESTDLVSIPTSSVMQQYQNYIVGAGDNVVDGIPYTYFSPCTALMNSGDQRFYQTAPLIVPSSSVYIPPVNGGFFRVDAAGVNIQFNSTFVSTRLGQAGETYNVRLHYVDENFHSTGTATITASPTSIKDLNTLSINNVLNVPANTRYIGMEHLFILASPMSLTATNTSWVPASAAIDVVSQFRAVVWADSYISGTLGINAASKLIMGGVNKWSMNVTPVIERGGVSIAASSTFSDMQGIFFDTDQLTQRCPFTMRTKLENGTIAGLRPEGNLDATYFNETTPFQPRPGWNAVWENFTSTNAAVINVRVQQTVAIHPTNPLIPCYRYAKDCEQEWQDFKQCIGMFPVYCENDNHFRIYHEFLNAVEKTGDLAVRLVGNGTNILSQIKKAMTTKVAFT